MPVLSTDTARLNGMPKPSAATTPFHLVYGGDSYLNDQTVRDLKHEAQRRYPDAETIELDAANADHYAFDEAVSPSLLADRAIVIVTNLQNADEKLGDAMVSYCRQACKEPADACIVICQHEGGVKGKRLVEQLTKAGAYKDAVADLKKPNEKVVTFLGRITMQKGPEYFVEAAAMVLHRTRNIRFVMAGSGDMMDQMIRLVAERGIADRFHFPGFMKGSQVYEMLKASDVYIMPSVSEPFGISPLEAMQCSVPTIISKQSGCAEILDKCIKTNRGISYNRYSTFMFCNTFVTFLSFGSVFNNS